MECSFIYKSNSNEVKTKLKQKLYFAIFLCILPFILPFFICDITVLSYLKQ